MRFFLFFFIFLVSCHSCLDKDLKKKEIKIGVIAGPEAKLMESVKKIAQEKFGLDIKIVEFTDYMMPNIALSDGSIDANAFQHEPYLETMKKNRGLDLIKIANLFIYPMAAYSKKIKDKKELKINDKIAIPNDPSNSSRALLLLESEGLIKLKDKNKGEISINDIYENPLNLQIVELDAAQLPRVLDDVAISIINTTFAKAAGLHFKTDGLFREKGDSLYVNILVIRRKDKDEPFVQKLIKSIQNEEVIKAAKSIFQEDVIPGF